MRKIKGYIIARRNKTQEIRRDYIYKSCSSKRMYIKIKGDQSDVQKMQSELKGARSEELNQRKSRITRLRLLFACAPSLQIKLEEMQNRGGDGTVGENKRLNSQKVMS